MRLHVERKAELRPSLLSELPHGLRPTSLKKFHRSFSWALGPLSEPAGESESFPRFAPSKPHGMASSSGLLKSFLPKL